MTERVVGLDLATPIQLLLYRPRRAGRGTLAVTLGESAPLLNPDDTFNSRINWSKVTNDSIPGKSLRFR